MDIVLGLDLGTTNCKVVAIDASGQPVATVARPTPTRGTARGEEYDALELWHAFAGLIRQTLEQLGAGARVLGIAVASLGESGVLIDNTGQPLAASIVWHDKRTAPWADWWRQRISESDLYRIVGLPLRHIYSVNKILWHREQEPAAFARADTWLCLADWITFCLTGQRSASYSTACRTMLFDVRARAWSDELLHLAGLPTGLMPPAFPSGQVIGNVTPGAARATGLSAGTPVALGGHDHICAALAAGIVGPGRVLDSSGTVEAALVALDQPILDYAVAGGMACGCHTARDRYYLIGGIMSGSVVDWLARLFAGEPSPETVTQLMEQAATAPVGAHGLWFEPYLDGAAAHLRDPEAWGAWLGLRLHHTRADLTRAAMEGLSFGIRHLLETIQRAAGFPFAELCAVGGGSRNAWWQQLKADVVGVPIETLAATDVSGQGAALLAGIDVGMFKDEADAIARAYRPATRYAVSAENHARYDHAYRDVFLKLYPALKDIPLG